MCCDGLDHPPHCHQRKAERWPFVYRHHDYLLRLQRPCGRVLLSVRICLWRSVPFRPSLPKAYLRCGLGMCAFGIIIGDTLPQVFRSLFPTLPTIPILKLFGNRQFVIAFCTVCFSYPLSLYRDIHKLARASGLALVGMVIIVFAVLIEGPHVPPALKGTQEGKFSIIAPGVFQAIGVISFAFGKSFYPLTSVGPAITLRPQSVIITLS